MQDSTEVVTQTLKRATKGQFLPWEIRLAKPARIERLVVGCEVTPDLRCGVDDNDRDATGV